MRSVADQIELVRGLAEATGIRRVPLAEAEGLVLAEDVVARVPVPPFTNSAMDGFAVRAADVAAATGEAPVRLRVVGDIPAGLTSCPRVGVGEAARIMTGAPVPEGADTIVPVELTDQPRGAAPLPAQVEIAEAVALGRHVRRQGENVRVGDVVLPAGTVLQAAACSSIASVGLGEVAVRERPRVAVIATGDELLQAGTPLGFGQIPDSNSLLLAGLARQFGAEVVAVARAGDNGDEFARVLAEVTGEADVVVTTGGVSVGAFDVVRAVIDAEFTPVAMQPGKPQGAGRIAVDGRELAFLGLPGNPVSVFVSAWVYLRELLAAMTGATPWWPTVRLPSAGGWGSPEGREQYVPVRIEEGQVVPVHGLHSGSHLVASLARADALAVVPAEVSRVEPGDDVEVRLVRGAG